MPVLVVYARPEPGWPVGSTLARSILASPARPGWPADIQDWLTERCGGTQPPVPTGSSPVCFHTPCEGCGGPAVQWPSQPPAPLCRVCEAATLTTLNNAGSA